ncbi:hypothetical protein [Neorhizobium sp. DAR64872/K0K18]|uniref:hypothetical protein n=1 Tax=Neorhizobium sp. DAR64872/K0K18 TaxID=3421958 RepID=UPI003D2D8CF6
MDDITPPKPGSSDRFIDCQEAIETRVHQIVEDAYIAGWENPSEVLAAIIEIADNLALQYGENEALKEVLDRLKSNKPFDD